MLHTCTIVDAQEIPVEISRVKFGSSHVRLRLTCITLPLDAPLFLQLLRGTLKLTAFMNVRAVKLKGSRTTSSSVV